MRLCILRLLGRGVLCSMFYSQDASSLGRGVLCVSVYYQRRGYETCHVNTQSMDNPAMPIYIAWSREPASR